MSGKSEKKPISNKMASGDKYFAIENVASNNKDTVIVGGFDRANNKPSLNSVAAEIKPGVYAIPNHSLVWGKRVKEAKTGKYTGEVLFDKVWGEGSENGYEAVRIRYVKNSKSIDYQYLVDNKIYNPLTDEGKDSFIDISSEITYIDKKIDPSKVLFLENASVNGRSICRNPEAIILYKTYESGDKTRKALSDFDKMAKAMNIIKECREDEEKSMVLASMFGIDPNILHENILEILIDKSQQNVSAFLKHIDLNISTVETILETAVSMNRINLKLPGVIQVRKDEIFEIVLEDETIPESPEMKILWVKENIYNNSVYSMLIDLKEFIK